MNFKQNFKKFKNVSDIFPYQLSRIKIFLVRFDFNQTDYYRKNINQHFEFSYIQTTIQWAIIFFMSCVFLKLIDESCFILIWEQAIRVQHYDIFISTPLIGFIAIEKMFNDSFDQLFRYRHGMIETLFELTDQIDGEMGRIEKISLLDFYNKINHYSILNYKFNCCCLVPLVIQLSYLAIVQHLNGNIDTRLMMFYICMFILINLYAAYTLSALYVILPDVAFVLKIFRSKFTKCQIFLKYTNASLNVSFLNKFITEYMHLYRRVVKYNSTFSGIIQAEDLVFKLSGVVVWIFYIKQDEPLNHVSYIILFLYTATYCLFQLVLSRLGYFPEQNHKSYQYLSSLNARSQRVFMSQQRRSMSYLNASNPNEDLRKILKINCFANVMVTNRLGFTYGNQYLITKKEVFTALFHDFYMLTLFYKRLSV